MYGFQDTDTQMPWADLGPHESNRSPHGAFAPACAALAQLAFAEPEPWLKDFDFGELGGGVAAAEWKRRRGRCAAHDSRRRPWLDSLCAGGDVEPLGQLKSAEGFEQTLVECKRLSAKADSLIEDMKARTPR